MSAVNMNIQVDAGLQKKAQALCDSIGLSFNTAVNLLLRQAVQEQSIPVQTERGTYSEEELYRKIDRGMEQIHAGYGVVKSLDELKAAAAQIEQGHE